MEAYKKFQKLMEMLEPEDIVESLIQWLSTDKLNEFADEIAKECGYTFKDEEYEEEEKDVRKAEDYLDFGGLWEEIEPNLNIDEYGLFDKDKIDQYIKDNYTDSDKLTESEIIQFYNWLENQDYIMWCKELNKYRINMNLVL